LGKGCQFPQRLGDMPKNNLVQEDKVRWCKLKSFKSILRTIVQGTGPSKQHVPEWGVITFVLFGKYQRGPVGWGEQQKRERVRLKKLTKYKKKSSEPRVVRPDPKGDDVTKTTMSTSWDSQPKSTLRRRDSAGDLNS